MKMQKIYVTLNIKGDVEKLHEIHKSARLQSLYGLPQRANRKEGNMALKNTFVVRLKVRCSFK